MCGLSVIFSEDVTYLRKSMDALKHRGIRERLTSYADDRVHVGHRRLPIQGPGTGYDHPQCNDTWDAYMVGEVLNFRDFAPGAGSDLPVVLRRWTESGIASMEAYDGFWAMVFVDKNNNHIHVVTDPLAKKPLYYRTTAPYGVSSEIESLACLGPRTRNDTYMAGVAKWGYVYSEETPWKEVQKIPPYTHVVFDANGNYSSFFQYGQLVPTKDGGNLIGKMRTAVKNRLNSDYPIALLLSGGLDSTIIFQLVKELTTDFTIFHVDNEEAEFLNYLNIPNAVRTESVKLEAVDLWTALKANQTPVDLGSVVPQYALAKAVADKGFHVTLSGDGADELFGGYRRAIEYDSQYSDIFHELVYYHLPRLDRIMMSHTIELRCPFLSWEVVQHALTIPWTLRKRKERLKHVFRQLVPLAIIERQKVPLKIDGIRKDKMAWRQSCLQEFERGMNS